jgi:spore germination protein KB
MSGKTLSVLSTRQFSYLMFLSLVGNALILAPIGSVGRDIWAANLLGSLSGLYVIYVILSIQKTFPGLSIIEASELCLGKIAGKGLSLLFLLMIFYSCMVYLFEACILIRTIFPFLTCYLLRPLMILTAAYCIYKGINAVGRLAEVFQPLAIFFIACGLILMASVADFSRLQPVLADLKPVLGGAINGAGWPYSGVVVLALFLPFVNDLKTKQPIIYIWYFIAVFIFVIRSIIIMGALGPQFTMLVRFPMYATLRMIVFADFQRVELFFFIIWISSGFIVLLVNYLAGLLVLKNIFSLPGFKSLILPFGFLVTVISLYMYSSDMEFYSLESPTSPLINLTIGLLYPTIILIAAKLRRKSLPPTDTKPDNMLAPSQE